MNKKVKHKCTTFSHIDEDGHIVEKNKICYDTDKEAIEVARRINLKEKTIHKMVAYKCDVCHLWHIGKSRRILTEKDREHYKNVKSKLI